ncbi:MAG: BatA domain-containing protein, partial [Bacteroidetes bacterium]|nr:BatA domain-containing protein [Bacteroidota bacterium]
MFQLENKYFLYALSLVPVFIIIYWLLNRWRKKAIAAYGDVSIVKQLIPDVSTSKRIWKFILFTLA